MSEEPPMISAERMDLLRKSVIWLRVVHERLYWKNVWLALLFLAVVIGWFF